MWKYKVTLERDANFVGNNGSNTKMVIEENWSGSISEAAQLAYMFRTLLFGLGFSPKTINEHIPDPEGGSYEGESAEENEEGRTEEGGEENVIPTIIPDEVA